MNKPFKSDIFPMIKVLFILLIFILVSCNPTGQLIKKEQYDRAIEKLTIKMRDGKASEKQLAQLKQAYHTANQLDHDRVMLLRKSGQPDIWHEVYDCYKRIYDRQQRIKTIPESFRQKIDFKPLDIENDLAAAKSKAQTYLFASAEKLLKTKNRTDARQAYNILMELSKLGHYDGMDAMMRRALLQGTNQVLLTFRNELRIELPEDFESKLMGFNLSKTDFVQYDFEAADNKVYDYTINIIINEIVPTPERIETRAFVEKAEIESGTKPLRDEQGQIVLDSLGKVIEVADYKTVEAIVNETVQHKALTVNGKVEYVNMLSNRRELTTPISATMKFRNAYAVVNGDLKAISTETRKMMQNRALPFPSDYMMVRDAAEPLREVVKDIIWKEKRIVSKSE